MGQCSTVAVFEALLVPAGVKTHDLSFQWPLTYQKATGESVPETIILVYMYRCTSKGHAAHAWLGSTCIMTGFGSVMSVTYIRLSNSLQLHAIELY